MRDVEMVGPHRVRFHLHEPWPDFMTFCGTYATSAAWIAPKKYMEPALMLIDPYPWSAPLEEVRLRK